MDRFLTDLAKSNEVETKYKIGEAVGMQIVNKILYKYMDTISDFCQFSCFPLIN